MTIIYLCAGGTEMPKIGISLKPQEADKSW